MSRVFINKTSTTSQDEFKIPIIIGCARVTKPQHAGFHGNFLPSQLAIEAVNEAIKDASASSEDALRNAIDCMGMPFHREEKTNNTTQMVAEGCGITLPPKKDYYGGPGSSGQLYVNTFCKNISEGTELGVACVAMCEARHSRKTLRKQGKRWAVDSKDRKKPRELRICAMPGIGVSEEVQQAQEQKHGFTTPNWCYSLYENALRARAGRSYKDHLLHIGKIYERYSENAAKAPEVSWFPNKMSAEEIAVPNFTPGNRAITNVYTRQCCAFNEVDMAAAALVTSVGMAKKLGIPEDKWVYVHGTASTEDTSLMSSRAAYHQSIQHHVGFKKVLEMARKTVDDISFFDIYSPYPCMPQLAAEALNLPVDDRRGWNLVGGHSFHGAPGAGFGCLMVVAMAQKCRENRGQFGLVNTNGGRITTQGYGIYSTEPFPQSVWQAPIPGSYAYEVNTVKRPIFNPVPSGNCVIEVFTVCFGHEFAMPNKDKTIPNMAIIVGRLMDGSRFVCNTKCTYNDKGRATFATEPLMRLLNEEEWIGGTGTVTQDETGRNIITLGSTQ